MIISGLLLTLSEDAPLADRAEAALRARPEFTLAERSQRWLPVAIEVENVRASRDLHDWLNTLPGVEFVDVVQVNFEEEMPPEGRARSPLRAAGEDEADTGVQWRARSDAPYLARQSEGERHTICQPTATAQLER